MNATNDPQNALSSPSSSDAILILNEIIRSKDFSVPEIRFLALLAIYKPALLRQADIAQLAEAMISWGQRHLKAPESRS